MQDASPEELDLVGVLWQRKRSLLLAVVLGSVLGYSLSQLQTVQYSAESRVFLSSAAAFDPLGQRSAGNQERYVVQQAELMSSQPVLDLVELPPSLDRDDLGEAISVTASADSDLVVVTATAPVAEDAAALADEVAIAYQAYTAERVEEAANRAVAAVSDPDQAEQIRAAAAVYDDGVALVDNAVVPTSPSQPAPLRNAVLLAVLSGLLCAAAIVLNQSHRAGRGSRGGRGRGRRPDGSAHGAPLDDRVAVRAAPGTPQSEAATVGPGEPVRSSRSSQRQGVAAPTTGDLPVPPLSTRTYPHRATPARGRRPASAAPRFPRIFGYRLGMGTGFPLKMRPIAE